MAVTSGALAFLVMLVDIWNDVQRGERSDPGACLSSWVAFAK